MIGIYIMKANIPKTINEHFDLKYGKVGTERRADFEQKAETYYYCQGLTNSKIRYLHILRTKLNL